MRIGIDVDDVLLSCNEYALELLNNEKGKEFGLHHIQNWSNNDPEVDERMKFIETPEFYEKQRVLPGAREFVELLQNYGEVFFVTAVSPKYVSIRAKRLKEEFPNVPETNYVFTNRKDLVDVDTLLDDGPHNILNSPAKYPVLFRKPWNNCLSGMLSVTSYREYLCMVARFAANIRPARAPSIVCLVGPSGSGKTAIAEELCSTGVYARPKTYTTRQKRDNEPGDAYHFVSPDEFRSLDFLETTVYAGYSYGTRAEAIEKVLEEGKRVVFALDICGANAIRAYYGDKACLVFVKRPKPDLVRSILERNIPIEEKTTRLLSLEDEDKNEFLCDFVLTNNRSVRDAAALIESWKG